VTTIFQGDVATSSASDQLTGRLLAGRYRLNRPIASGGMAQVYEATDETLARRVAVKILHPHLAFDHAFVQRFRAEAVAAARLTHPSIVSIYDTVVDGEVNAIVMELVRGTTLRADIDAHGPLQLGAVLAIGTQVADALAAAHAAGLVHRDVKPANILLSADGRVLVADFGIAKAAQGGDHTDDGAMVGTAKYLAPEQVEGRPVDARTDVYALGIVLYEALTGVPPFRGDTDTATALLRLHTDPVRPRQLRPDIPVAVEAVIGRALARRPDDRFPSATALRTALVEAGADPARASQAAPAAVATAAPGSPMARSGTTPPPSPPSPPGPMPGARYQVSDADPDQPTDRPRGGAGAIVIVLLVLGAAAAAVYVGFRGTDPVGSEVAVAAFTTFDPPPGSGGENDDQLPNLTDDDPASAWTTETYRNRDVTVLKPGVGLVATLGAAGDLSTVTITSPSTGWRAEVLVVDGPRPGDRAGWGEPVATIDGATPGETRVDLGGRRGSAVMVWFTDVGDDHAVAVRAVEVRGP
jgi:serine/threonine-protein kinase